MEKSLQKDFKRNLKYMQLGIFICVPFHSLSDSYTEYKDSLTLLEDSASADSHSDSNPFEVFFLIFT